MVRRSASGSEPEDGVLAAFTGADGLPAQSWRVDLPPLPMGRHRVWREDAPEAVCHVTVAPRRCYLPDTIRRGARRFGIAAQLYALRRDNDQGIGDFTTLAKLAEAAGREGAATIGINPLHMLFPQNRERASPYHPSDRRFLDPIYLDVGDRDIAAGDHCPAPARPPANDLVAYSSVWASKLAALERSFVAFTARDPLAADFRRFIDDGGARSLAVRGISGHRRDAAGGNMAPMARRLALARQRRGQGVRAANMPSA